MVTDVNESMRGYGKAAEEAMLRALHENSNDERASLEQLIHPQAEMRLLVSFGRPLRGRVEVITVLDQGWAAGVFSAKVRSFQWLDERTVLTTATARYALEGGGMASGVVYWLDEFRDGLIFRVTAFRQAEEARRAHESRRAGSSPQTGPPERS